MIEAQFHAVFGVDLTDTDRPWRWFLVRLTYLISTAGALHTVLHPQTESDLEPPGFQWTD